jgi:hypothetical protein
MRSLGKVPQLIRRCAIGLAILLFFAPATLWGCPLCYAKAMSSSGGLLQAFRNGIVILMVPPFVMSIVFTVTAYRRRNSFHPPSDNP